VRENKILLRKLSGGTAHLSTLEETLLMNEEMSSFFCQVFWLSHVQTWCCSCTRNLLYHPIKCDSVRKNYRL